MSCRKCGGENCGSSAGSDGCDDKKSLASENPPKKPS